jgi:hypothetical protein
VCKHRRHTVAIYAQLCRNGSCLLLDTGLPLVNAFPISELTPAKHGNNRKKKQKKSLPDLQFLGCAPSRQKRQVPLIATSSESGHCQTCIQLAPVAQRKTDSHTTIKKTPQRQPKQPPVVPPSWMCGGWGYDKWGYDKSGALYMHAGSVFKDQATNWWRLSLISGCLTF